MIRTLAGTLREKGDDFVVVDLHGAGLKAFMAERSLARLPKTGEPLVLFVHLRVREDALELYGFRTDEELGFFEKLIAVSGVGPRSALAILDVADLRQIAAAIQENRPDLLTQASGIGRKTAERIIIELKDKVRAKGAGETVRTMERDADLVETLVGLGYRREESRDALAKVDPSTKGLQERLKSALKILGGR